MSQLVALLRKNWIFTVRRWKLTLLQLLAPFVFVILLTLIDLLPKTTKDNPYNPLPRILHQETVEIGPIAKCREWNGIPCKTIRYVIENQSNRTKIEHFISEYFLPESGLAAADLEEMSSTDALKSHVVQFPNTTTNGIEFHQWGGIYNYTIHFNASSDLISLISPNRKPDNRNELQIALDKAIFRYHYDELPSNRSLNTENIRYSSRLFPQLGYKSGKRAADDIGFVFFYCGIMFQSIILLYNLTSEKELLLRQGLKIIGLRDSAYWMSWVVTAILQSTIAVIILTLTGIGLDIKLFSQSDYTVTFMMFFLFALSSISLTIFASSFIQKSKSSLTIGMLLFILGVLFIAIVSKKEIKQILRDPGMVDQWIPQLFSVIFPFYNLGEAMCEIDRVVNGMGNNTYFSWTNLYDEIAYRKKINSTFYETVYLPNGNQSFLLLLANFAMYGLLGLYFDQILSGPNGEPRKWYFPFEPLINRLRRPVCIHLEYDNDIDYEEPHETSISTGNRNNLDVQEEEHIVRRLLTRSGEENQMNLQIAGLSKIFSKGCIKPLNHKAVNKVWLGAQEGEILAVLGHNGAGKTTTIKMLTGLLRPSRGDAYINGLSIRDQMNAIRQQLGVCPQHDVLWDDLTSREHFSLFGALKGMTENDIHQATHTLLSDVSLLKAADRPVRTFSGGMKRRLSVALSFLGSPKIVFLDEPSSGMDPYIRRDLWNLILRMRQNRVILMTTHSMEEADILASKIAVMVDGKVRAVGSPIELKNRFAGYNIKLSVAVESSARLSQMIQSELPMAIAVKEELQQSGESFQCVYKSIEMPPGANESIARFLDTVEAATGVNDLCLGSCSVSQTTLEQVFLKVTSTK